MTDRDSLQLDNARNWALPAGILLMLAMMVGFQPMPFDPDLWFHLADGRLIAAKHCIPQADPFSFTRHGALWVPHSWLFDLFVSAGFSALGPRMVEAVMALIYAATLLISLAIIARRRAPAIAALAICAGLAVAAGNSRGIRPQTCSLLLCNVVIYLMLRHRHAPSRRIMIALPLIFLLWAQIHGACVMGLIIVAIWLVGRTVDRMVADRLADCGQELQLLAAALIFSILAVLLTPHAISHFQYLALTMGLKGLRQTDEWMMPRALSLAVPDLYAYLLLAGMILLLARGRRRAGWAETILFLSLLTLAFSGVRHIPLACIGAVPLIADLLGRRSTDEPALAEALRPARPLLAIASIALFALLWRFPADVDTRYARVEPVIGARALATLGQPRNVFTTYNTGPYVLWTAPGKLKVFLDSRADVYGDEIILQAQRAQSGLGWKQLFNAWNIDAAVIESDYPLAEILRTDPDWMLLAEDPRVVTFIRASTVATRAETNRKPTRSTLPPAA